MRLEITAAGSTPTMTVKYYIKLVYGPDRWIEVTPYREVPDGVFPSLDRRTDPIRR